MPNSRIFNPLPCLGGNVTATLRPVIDLRFLDSEKMIESLGKADLLHLSEEQVALIRAELRAILTSSSFSGSKRCQDFLEFVVERTLVGDHESLTERFLGARLFGRAIDYETATDSIVRVRASDVRRRLLQYYSSQPSPIVRINLVAGGYIPEFHWREEETFNAPSSPERTMSADGPETVSTQATSFDLPIGAYRASRSGWLRRTVWITVSVCLLAIALIAWKQLSGAPQNDMERFWAPVLRGRGGVLICFGDTTRYWLAAKLVNAIAQHPESISIEPGQLVLTHDESLSAGNFRAALSLMQFLDRHNVANQLRWPQEVQSVDLDTQNTVFVGAFNNSWTMSLNRNLRFSFELGGTADEPVWMIKDHGAPNSVWSLAKTDPQPIDHDFAVITRVLDPARKRVVMSVGGLNQFGTEAAGEFLVDEASWKEFAHMAPKGWESKNIQIVLEMEVSNHRPVRPRIIAFHLW